MMVDGRSTYRATWVRSHATSVDVCPYRFGGRFSVDVPVWVVVTMLTHPVWWWNTVDFLLYFRGTVLIYDNLEYNLI